MEKKDQDVAQSLAKQATKQMPSVGRIVHYTESEGEPVRAAMIIAVHNPECVNLVSWNSYGTQSTHTSVLQGAGAKRWDWPARV